MYLEQKTSRYKDIVVLGAVHFNTWLKSPFSLFFVRFVWTTFGHLNTGLVGKFVSNLCYGNAIWLYFKGYF